MDYAFAFEQDNRAILASSQPHCESITHCGFAHPWVLALISVTSRSTQTFAAHPQPSGFLLILATLSSPPSRGLRALRPVLRGLCTPAAGWCTPG
ncbi:hypothetical protein NQZ68_032176 [Dissostichus eleginoides]|nr:hypothetical protein NQZ68_032176 [Dissostichus eleginoides]